MKQYYYHADSCLATGHKGRDDPKCICWYDEGTGPKPEWRHDDDDPVKTWRDKPEGRQHHAVVPGVPDSYGGEEINTDCETMSKEHAAIKRAKEIVAAVEWSEDPIINMLLAAGRALSKRVDELEAELKQHNAPPIRVDPETRLHVMNEAQSATLAKAKVMEAFARGEQIQCKYLTDGSWNDIESSLWNWRDYDYRIKPREPRVFYVNEYHGNFGSLKESLEDARECAVGDSQGILKLVEVLDE